MFSSSSFILALAFLYPASIMAHPASLEARALRQCAVAYCTKEAGCTITQQVSLPCGDLQKTYTVTYHLEKGRSAEVLCGCDENVQVKLLPLPPKKPSKM